MRRDNIILGLCGLTIFWFLYTDTGARAFSQQSIRRGSGEHTPAQAIVEAKAKTPEAIGNRGTESTNQIGSSGSETVWTIPVVDSAGSVGRYSSIYMDNLGHPCISYCDSTNGNLKYALRDGVNWNTSVIEGPSNVGQYASLAIDNSGNRNISYYNVTNGALKYTGWPAPALTWNLQEVDAPGNVGQFSSLDLDPFDLPRISYYDSTNGDLKLASWNGVTWSKEIIDNIGDVGRYTSILIDEQGHKNISYFDVTGRSLKYAGSLAQTWVWSLQSVDMTGDVGQYTSIDLDGEGLPCISYYDATNADLKFSQWNGSAWTKQTVDGSGNVGMHNSLAIGGSKSGSSSISYYDATNSALKLARIATSIEDPGQESGRKTFALSQNYPNPFNPQTLIEYTLPKAGPVNLTVYNILGQRVRTLVDEHQIAGSKKIAWDGKDDNGEDVASGIYFFRLEVGEFSDVKKMVLLK